MKIGFPNKQFVYLWLALLFTAGWVGVALPHGQENVTATLDADGRAFTFTEHGVMAFKGSFSATLVMGGHPHELLSAMDQIVLPAGQTQVLHSVAVLPSRQRVPLRSRCHGISRRSLKT